MLAGIFVSPVAYVKIDTKRSLFFPFFSAKTAGFVKRHGPGLATGDELILSCTYDTTARTAPTGFGDFTQILVIPNVRRCEFGTLSKAFHSPQEIFGRRKT